MTILQHGPCRSGKDRMENTVDTVTDLEAHKDRALLEAVRDHLMKDQRLSGQSINVTASGGFIQITGVVDTEEHKQLALEMARGLVGVHSVEDHIEVREQHVTS